MYISCDSRPESDLVSGDQALQGSLQGHQALYMEAADQLIHPAGGAGTPGRSHSLPYYHCRYSLTLGTSLLIKVNYALYVHALP